MTTILLIHHCPTPTLRVILSKISESIMWVASSVDNDGADNKIELWEVAALEPDIAEFLAADGYIFLTPANIGYISGAMKHYLDIVYNAALADAQQKFYTAIIHGNYDTSGAARALTKICQGMGLQIGYPIVETMGEISSEDTEHIQDAAASLTARVNAQW